MYLLEKKQFQQEQLTKNLFLWNKWDFLRNALYLEVSVILWDSGSDQIVLTGLLLVLHGAELERKQPEQRIVHAEYTPKVDVVTLEVASVQN